MKTLRILAFVLFVPAMPSLAQTHLLASESSAPAQSSESPQFGFRTVEEALSSLKADPTVTITVTKPDAWQIASQASTKTQWSFTPSGHYAHPMVVKRVLRIDSKGDLRVETTSLCHAEKQACERLLAEFAKMGEEMRASVHKKLREQAEKK